MYPDPPLEVVPEVKLKAPLIPDTPAFGVMILISPLDVGAL